MHLSKFWYSLRFCIRIQQLLRWIFSSFLLKEAFALFSAVVLIIVSPELKYFWGSPRWWVDLSNIRGPSPHSLGLTFVLSAGPQPEDELPHVQDLSLVPGSLLGLHAFLEGELLWQDQVVWQDGAISCCSDRKSLRCFMWFT